MTGQDSERGTFSHRHAVLRDVEFGHSYCPLETVAANGTCLEIHNSPLSEAGVLGFEYGYSQDWPDGLVCWEAQFGDFVNAAQVIIDQFISSAEDKWMRLSGVTLLLPHGFEGQGPEHSSARLERFLMLAAEDNIQVVYPTTPAQYFHALRRQVVRRWRKPLIVMTPKSLLRHPACHVEPQRIWSAGTSSTCSTTTSRARIPSACERVLMCSGKVYYDLVERRAETERDDVAILRVEQLYPLADETSPRRWRPTRTDAGLLGSGRAGEHGRLVLPAGALRRQASRPISASMRRAAASASPATGSAASAQARTETAHRSAFAGLGEKTRKQQ